VVSGSELHLKKGRKYVALSKMEFRTLISYWGSFSRFRSTGASAFYSSCPCGSQSS